MNAGSLYHPIFGREPVRYRLDSLSEDPDEQVADTIGRMIEYACEDSSKPEIQEDAQLALQLGGGDPLLGVYRLVSSRFRFQNDDVTASYLPASFGKFDIVEVLIRPVDVALMWRRNLQPVDDCDGYHSYASSLLLALGVPCSYCTVAADLQEPDRFSHVYLVAYPEGVRTPIDCSHGKYVGWEVPDVAGVMKRRKEWPVRSSGLLNALLVVAGLVLLAHCFLGARFSEVR
jgi:hypothetical protein